MVGDSVKYILPIINSKLIHWYFISCMGTTSGVGTNRWLKYTVEAIPVPLATNEAKSTIISLLERRLINSYDNNVIDKEIDKNVYSIYGLDEDEISFIEGAKGIDD